MGGVRVRAVVGVLALCLLTAGCLGPLSDTNPEEAESELTGDYSADEFDTLLSGATTANEELDSFSFDMSMEMSGAGEQITMDASGVTDLAAEEMKMDFDMSGMGMVGPSDFVMYIDGQDAFMNVDGEWVQMPADQANQNVWDVEGQLAIADAQYEHGDVHVDAGSDIIEVTTTLDSDEMAAFIDEAESADPTVADAGSVEWRDVEIVERFDAESNHLRSTEMTAEMVQGDQAVEYTFEMQIDDIDEEFDTTVPDEGREEAETTSGSTI
ncbi:hypothetical protein Halru_0848 [Halovivax ruber XH-70]|uniref:Uncharacterized protein n=1 Tax=Halovivax ruber (strain DSM 18193 / JCM 13892 / XH-70) TaxID=797302 RepID=L0IBY9_HALRX|nr:DUF6612 family protein [Halovivax ruber]AGB15472.1 hypothetical protein Halru_0848 [Halovivax ruber XH-70]